MFLVKFETRHGGEEEYTRWIRVFLFADSDSNRDPRTGRDTNPTSCTGLLLLANNFPHCTPGESGQWLASDYGRRDAFTLLASVCFA